MSIEQNTIAGDSHQATTFHALPVVDAMTPPAPRLSLVGGVGDIASGAKGSGARYNVGKAPLELIPLLHMGQLALHRGGLTEAQEGAAKALRFIGEYQSRARGAEALYDALWCLGDPEDVWRECAIVFDYGKRKYVAWNWAKGMAWSIPIACAARHLVFGILAGEQNDPESTHPHRGHVACNIVMLITYAQNYLDGDDRPAAGLLAHAPAANDAAQQASA